VLAGLQPQAQSHQAACVLNRAASELSGGVGGRGRASGTGEALEGTSARSPCLAPRLSRKFWSAGDYDAAATGSAPQPPSMSQCWFFFWVRTLLILCSTRPCSMLTTFTPLQVCRIACASTLNFSTPTRLRINGHLEVKLLCGFRPFFFSDYYLSVVLCCVLLPLPCYSRSRVVG
jgi:hypothetical protein